MKRVLAEMCLVDSAYHRLTVGGERQERENNWQRKQQQLLHASFMTASKKSEKNISLLLLSEMPICRPQYNLSLSVFQ